jgi:hypothetical protein
MSSTVVIALAGLLTGSPWSNFASVWGSSVAGEDRNPPVWAWDFEVRWLAPGCHFGGPLSVGLNHCTPLYPSLVCTLSVLEVPDHSDGEPMTTKTASCHEVTAYQSSASALSYGQDSRIPSPHQQALLELVPSSPNLPLSISLCLLCLSLRPVRLRLHVRARHNHIPSLSSPAMVL